MFVWHGNERSYDVTIKNAPDVNQGRFNIRHVQVRWIARGVRPLALRAAVGGPKRQSCRLVELVKASHPFQRYKRKRP